MKKRIAKCSGQTNQRWHSNYAVFIFKVQFMKFHTTNCLKMLFIWILTFEYPHAKQVNILTTTVSPVCWQILVMWLDCIQLCCSKNNLPHICVLFKNESYILVVPQSHSNFCIENRKPNCKYSFRPSLEMCWNCYLNNAYRVHVHANIAGGNIRAVHDLFSSDATISKYEQVGDTNIHIYNIYILY